MDRLDQEISCNMENEDIKAAFISTLQTFSEKNSAISCEEILDEVYDVGELGVTFDVDELEEIKANFQKKMKDIVIFLCRFGILFHPSDGISPLKHRTAFEIILETFKAYPTDAEGNIFKEKIEETFIYLNDAIERWRSFVLTEDV